MKKVEGTTVHRAGPYDPPKVKEYDGVQKHKVRSPPPTGLFTLRAEEWPDCQRRKRFGNIRIRCFMGTGNLAPRHQDETRQGSGNPRIGPYKLPSFGRKIVFHWMSDCPGCGRS